MQRIHQKKELGCKAATYHTIEEGKSSAKESAFWEILGGRKPSHGKQPLYPKATCVVVLSLIGLMVCVSIVCCSSRADRLSKPYEALHVIACDSVMKYDST